MGHVADPGNELVTLNSGDSGPVLSADLGFLEGDTNLDNNCTGTDSWNHYRCSCHHRLRLCVAEQLPDCTADDLLNEAGIYDCLKGVATYISQQNGIPGSTTLPAFL